ncbi:hypothetical protein NC653_039877 [Populus alba x Populus x berolinensis]|uniref:Uncharacterized protein n=1 Tax=Populus alba x Populus x berolinensis TaxID=444605 RepID=A0AAD6LCB2_9ROSI|nr:hypothetical protein NC653_039877 [Populus alba x Populus x berolinensis]
MDHHRECRNNKSPYLGTDQVQFQWGRARDITLGFSSRGALTLIAILKMTKQAPSPVLVELITGLYSALEAVLSQEFNGVK